MKYNLLRSLVVTVWLCGAAFHVKAAEEVKMWPDIPLLEVVTEDGEFPTCEVLAPPEGGIGTGIDAEYVKGRLTMTLKGETLYESGEYVKDESGMRIKIRGNSTGAVDGQKPYKIKLSKKFDLLCRGDEDYKEKDWNLLRISTWNPGLRNSESNIQTALGFILSEAVGMEWTPGYTFVNLVMNGRYMGMYYLTDAVERGDKRVDIKKTGFLIESDAYWWKEDVYFRSNHQRTDMGYTFKHPDPDDMTAQDVDRIERYVNDFEDVLYSGGDISGYIDLSTFARWLLVQDLTCNADVAGTNKYLYKEDFAEEDPLSAKMKAGPLWDFDAMFKNPEDRNQWGPLHYSPYYYYPELFRHGSFVEAYKAVWEEMNPVLLDEVNQGFAALRADYGTALEESFELHKTVYPAECKNSLQEQMDELAGLLEARVEAFDSLMQTLGATRIEDVVVAGDDVPAVVFGLDGKMYPAGDGSLPKGVYVRRNADGTVEKFISK